MKKIALGVLLLFCLSSSIQGQDDSESSSNVANITTSSSPPKFSTAEPESLPRPTHLPASSDENISPVADPSAIEKLNHSSNETENSTAASGSTIGSTGPTVTTSAPLNSTSVPGNFTDNQDGANPSTRDNQTSTASNTTLSTTTTTSTTIITTTSTTTPLPTLAPSIQPQTPSASTKPQISTDLSATTPQSRGRSTTVTGKGTSALTAAATKSSTTTILTAKFSNPSELNVGDDTEPSSTSMDPLLAGLVSVFVVTAAVVSLLIFLKLRHRNERPEFRRLQDLPMDDMMEDTPLSMYSY